ncbi:FhaA domain-containing protein [Ruicaihuangia caeni]|uniref:DUF3662 and FHA domain-containing protein n=1 Tax=Ruicaihuangia caeni TaxID=3042517 RepID=A0AAW6TC38_9MICO|nr:DUF3662 and FHA domain-containing protein [Klugiella sp. YN-L-19]MDI2099162.1 DUF3662 and FHA domain-containing protein [Klugiella sp. YN-L-19]
MGLLDNFERGLERVVNGAFAKSFKSGVQPLELTSALKRELDTRAAVVARDRILVPNQFTLALAPRDYERMRRIGPSLQSELVQQVHRHASSQGYSFSGPVSVDLVEQQDLTEGMVHVESVNLSEAAVTWQPVLDVNGQRHPITKGRTIVGRGSEADITVNDGGISRKHIEVLWDGKRGQVNDLGSTNGSKLNGQPLRSAALEPDSVIDIGRTRIVFRVLAQSAPANGSNREPGARR